MKSAVARTVTMLVVTGLMFFMAAGCAGGDSSGTSGDSEGDQEGGFNGEIVCGSNSDCPPGMICNTGAGLCEDSGNADGDGKSEQEEAATDGDVPDESDSASDVKDAPESVEDLDGADGQEAGQILIEVQPDTLVFPPLTVDDDPVVQSFLIKSVGTDALTVKSLKLSGDTSANYFLEGVPTTPFAVAKEGQSISVKYKQSGGSTNGTVEIQSDASNHQMVRVALKSVEVGERQLSCKPQPLALDFGTVDKAIPLGKAMTITCENQPAKEGDDNVVILSQFEFDPVENGNFGLAPSTPSLIYIRSKQSKTIEVRFRPLEENQEQSVNLTFTHNADSIASPIVVPLHGTGGAKHLRTVSNAVHFGSVRIGHPASLPFTIESWGKFPVSVTGVRPAYGTPSVFTVDLGGLTISTDNPLVIPPETGKTFNVVFTPTDKPAVSGSIEVRSNAQESTLTITVDGSGTRINLTATPATVDFGVIDLRTAPVTQTGIKIKNDGDVAMVISNLAISPSQYTYALLAPPFGLAVSEEKTFQVTFNPTAEMAAALPGKIDFTIQNETEIFSLNLSGQAALPHVQLSPAGLTYDFGESPLGKIRTYVYKIKNVGGFPLSVSNFHWLLTGGDPDSALSASFTGISPIESQGERPLTFTIQPPLNPIGGQLPLQAAGTYEFTSNDPDALKQTIDINVQGTMINPFTVLKSDLGNIENAGTYFVGGMAPSAGGMVEKQFTIVNGGRTDGTKNVALKILAVQLIDDPASPPDNQTPSDPYFSLRDISDTLPKTLYPVNSSHPQGEKELTFTIRYMPLQNLGNHKAWVQIASDGYKDADFIAKMTGSCSNCKAGEHSCNGLCVTNRDVNHCGTRCTPCPAPDPAIGWADCDASLACKMYCDRDPAYELYTNPSTGAQSCVLKNDDNCCGTGCQNCQTIAPANSTGRCLGGTCGFQCDNYYYSDGVKCNPCNTADHCGITTCVACTVPADYHATAICGVNYQCSFQCASDTWGNCDGQSYNGCETNLKTNSASCGVCYHQCDPRNASLVCAEGKCACQESACQTGQCDPGWADCDGVALNGCEQDTLEDVDNCGGCDKACTIANGSGYCDQGKCKVLTCAAGYDDCDHDPKTGCEVHLSQGDPDNCGVCGRKCTLSHATATCDNSNCKVVSCEDGGWTDCDGVASNGCEVNILSSSLDPAHAADNCGGCGRLCHPANAIGMCSGGSCLVKNCISTDWADCNSNPLDGCETNLTNDTNRCGSCTIACVYPHAAGTCVSRTCYMGNCQAGWLDCDGPSNGCETNKLSDNNNCGACSHKCVNPINMTGTYCDGGACHQPACSIGYDDCDLDCLGKFESAGCINGCEKNVYQDTDNCGTCGHVCPAPGGTPICNGGKCNLSGCDTGFADCDHNASNGCEINTNSDPNNCGGCGTGFKCALPHTSINKCISGVCKVDICEPGYYDCNTSSADGCEIRTSNDVNNCGSCGHVCSFAHGTGICSAGVCTVTGCSEGYANCNGDGEDGCEVNLSDERGSGGCGAPIFVQRSDGGGFICGDQDQDTSKTYTDFGEKWFSVKVSECYSNAFCYVYLSAGFSLSVPAGVNYNMEWWSDCSHYGGVTTPGMGQNDYVGVCKNDSVGADDTFDIYFHIVFEGGNLCAAWSFNVVGNVSVTGCSNSGICL